MPQSPANLLLILDLDETLIHSSNTPLRIAHDFCVGPYYVHKRPFLDEFIATVSPAFELAVWSSSSSDYVETITGQIVPPTIPLQFQWSRSRCVQRYHPEQQDTYWVKDLKKVKRLGYDLGRTLIVDDTPEKLERNYGNAVYVKPFEGNPLDQELQVLAPYLLSLANLDDVRRVEKRGWRSRPL